MNKLMKMLMLSCKKASELIDKQSVVKLSWKENVQLQMHTAMCDGCKAYKKQSRLLDNLLQNHLHDSKEIELPVIANNKLKEEILSKL